MYRPKENQERAVGAVNSPCIFVIFATDMHLSYVAQKVGGRKPLAPMAMVGTRGLVQTSRVVKGWQAGR